MLCEHQGVSRVELFGLVEISLALLPLAGCDKRRLATEDQTVVSRSRRACSK